MNARIRLVSFMAVTLCVAGHAQNPAKQAAASNSPQAAAGSPTAGFKFVRRDWPTSPPVGSDKKPLPGTVILCYTLEITGGISQPFNFKRESSLKADDGKAVACLAPYDTQPTLQDSILVFAIDARNVNVTSITDFTLSLTTVQGTTLTPDSIRQSLSAASSTTNLGKKSAQALAEGREIYYLTWPNAVAGDVLPTATISANYLPPVAGQPWQKDTYYPPNSIVVPTNTGGKAIDGHYYLALTGGISAGAEPTWNAQPTFSEPGSSPCTWQAVNAASVQATQPLTTKPLLWAPNTSYSQGAFVVSLATGNTYVELKAACVSGEKMPTFVPSQARTPETLGMTDGKVTDNRVQYQDAGRDAVPCSTRTLFVWKPDTTVTTADTVCDGSDKNHQYKVITAGTTGHLPPTFVPANTPIDDGQLHPLWLDQGIVPPPSVAAAVPSEEPTTPLNGVPFPQTHSLSTFNLVSGVVVTTIRSPSFSFTTAPATNNGTPMQTGSSLIIDPVIFLTRYLKRFDAESKDRWSDIGRTFGPNLGISLSAPTSNFYVGASNELLRLIQFNYGFALAKVPQLAPSAYASSNATMPTTVQVFKKGAYFGLSFNISGFLSGLAGGSGSGGGGATGGGSGKTTGGGTTTTPAP